MSFLKWWSYLFRIYLLFFWWHDNNIKDWLSWKSPFSLMLRGVGRDIQMIFCQVTSISFLSKYISQSEMLIQQFSCSHLQSLQPLTASHTCQPQNISEKRIATDIRAGSAKWSIVMTSAIIRIWAQDNFV